MKRVLPLIASLFALLLAGCSAGSITAPRYVLSYGVSDYVQGYTGPYDDPNTEADDIYDYPPNPDLNAPAFDAQSMHELLVADGYSAALQAVACTDQYATKEQIRTDILALSSLDDDSIIVIFYSSHGTYAPAGYIAGYEGACLVPYDAIDPATCATVVDRLITPAELSSWISQSGKRNVIVIINTCFSGGFVDPGSSVDIAPQNYGPNDWGTTPLGLWTAIGYFGTLLSKNADESGTPGPIVISAAGSEEVSYELAPIDSYLLDNHGIFPYFIIQAAEKGDADGDGFVTATEAYAYAVAGIKTEWNFYMQNNYDSETQSYADFMPHISGGARDLVLFQK
jgi:hypothetical protein